MFLDNKNGWVVGIDGGIIHTGDGGTTWVKQNSGTTKHLMNITFTDKDYRWAVGEFSTVVHTADGGKTGLPSSLRLIKFITMSVSLTGRMDLLSENPVLCSVPLMGVLIGFRLCPKPLNAKIWKTNMNGPGRRFSV